MNSNSDISKRKRPVFIIVFFALVLGIGLVLGYLTLHGSQQHRTEHIGIVETKQLYTCGMHPNVIQDHPGNCPICGMKLVPLKKTVDEDKVSPEMKEDAIVIDPAVVQNIGLRSAPVETGAVIRLIKAVGYAVPAENRIGIVNLRFMGWIEKTYVNQTGQDVNIGDPLFDIYSPDLLSAQEEYLTTLRMVKSDKSALVATEQRLLNFGLTSQQVKEIADAGKPKSTITIISPFQGVVLMQEVLPGKFVEPGMELYRIADLAQIWVEVSVYDEDIPYLRLDLLAEMTVASLPGEKWRGKVSFVAPEIDEMNRDLKVRLEFSNPGLKLKPGMFASITIRSTLKERGVLVPKEAVIFSGERSIVFLDMGNGKYIPREIVLGVKVENDRYQVIKGLSAGEMVVVSGQFLLDSESSLRESTRKLREALPEAGEKGRKEVPKAGPHAEHTM